MSLIPFWARKPPQGLTRNADVAEVLPQEIMQKHRQ